MIKNTFNRILKQKFPGPHFSFTVLDLFKAIEYVAKEEPIGRGRLSRRLNLGGGEIRTLLKHMKQSGLIITSKAGCSLTDKGKELWTNINKIIPNKVILERNELVTSKYSFAVLVRNVKKKIKNGIEQRDVAVRAGAEGAITIVLEEEKLIIPKVSSDFSRDYPKAFNQISQSMKPDCDDGIIIAYADSLLNAEYGALATAWSLLD
jgi:predicted transcriptional regulator